MTALHERLRSVLRPAAVGVLLALGSIAASAFEVDLQGPFVGNVTSESAVIWWAGLNASPGTVVMGDRRLPDAEAPFELTVTDLEPATDYAYYLVLDDGGRLPGEGSFTFRTAPKRGSSEEFRFAVICDSRGEEPSEPVNVPVLRALLADAKAKGAQFVVFPGDLIFGYCNDAQQYRRQLRIWRMALNGIMHGTPVYTTMGNHDVLVHRDRDEFGPYDLDGVMVDGRLLTGEEAFAREFVNPTNGPRQPEAPGAPPYAETCYSFDYGNSHFVVLNTNYWAGTRTYPHEPGDPCRLYQRGNPEGRIMDRQMNWLRSDLNRARKSGARHIFVFGHEPAFPVGKHADDAMWYEGNATLSLKRDIRERQRKFWQMLSDHEVLVGFFGDEHNYSRGLMGPVGNREYDPPVWQVITGGAGAPPSDIRRTDLPWSDSIRVFETRLHYCLVTVSGRRAALEVLALPEGFDAASAPTELETIDRVQDLTIRD